jgi:hypothetical protein
MTEEINHDRRRVLGAFFASSAMAIAAADLGIIRSADRHPPMMTRQVRP